MTAGDVLKVAAIAEVENAVAVCVQPVIRLPSKPKWGTTCNGCGLCCTTELCVVGEVAFPGASAPCPALKIRGDGKSTYCQLVAIEIVAGMTPMLQEGLDIGKGCLMPDGVEVADPVENPKREIIY